MPGIYYVCFFNLLGLNASNIVFGGDDPTGKLPLNLLNICQLEHLDELRLKASSGHLMIDQFTEDLQDFVTIKAKKLVKLSFLSLKNIRIENLTAICQLEVLNHLELGSCDHLEPENLFNKLSELSNLKYLRLERGKINEDIGALNNLKSLTNLELIDFEMVPGFGNGLASLQGIRKFLLIPSYKDEVSCFVLGGHA